MINDNKLLKKLINDPKSGLEILMKEYMGLICVIVKNKLNDLSSIKDVEECISDVFYSFYEKRHEIDLKKGTIKAYLCIIAKRKSIDLFRKKMKETKIVSLEDHSLEKLISDDFSIEDQYLTKEKHRTIIQAICDLGEPDHEIIVRKYYFNESSKKISSILNMSVTAIDSRSSRAILKLRKKLGGIFNE